MNLNEIVANALDASDNPDPADVWAQVVASLPEHELRGHLLVAGRSYAASVATRHRSAAVAAAVGAGTSHAPASRWATAGATYRAILTERLTVEGGRWKMLGDATRDDLIWAAGSRIERAAQFTASAAWYQRLADLLDAHGVDTLSEVPADALTDAREAAA